MTRSARSTDAPAELQAEMNTAAFGAAHATSVMSERVDSKFAVLANEVKWIRWLSLATAAGVFGQYFGLGDSVSQAMPFR